LGSQKVVAKYKSSGIQVAGVFHLDMTGYTPRGEKEIIGISTDFVNSQLSDFLRLLTDSYIEIPWQNTKCGYGCSDHARFE
jgi:bacterial leucyl aminopeptidase